MRLNIPVQGMNCEGCAQALSTALQRMEGVHDAKSDFESARVRVRIDPAQVSEQEVYEVIRACGYEPQAAVEVA